MIYRSAGDISYILHEQARHYFGAGAGLLSIKSFYGGQALYNVGRGQYLLDETSYLTLNHGQPYALTIESAAPVESFCLFFAPGLAEEVYRSLSTPANHLLAEPYEPAPSTITFFERSYPRDDLLSPFLGHLRRAVARPDHDSGWLTEQFYRAMAQLLQIHFNIYKELENLTAARAATREELYRRLHLARDYMAAAYDQPLALADIAAVAGLSPNHLLRTFKQLFRQTPHQYLTGRRLKQSQKLLRQTDLAVR
jgi:AraC-like DNA-binding protein